MVRVPPLSENIAKCFSRPAMTIHTPIDSPCRNVFFLNFFELISGQKNPKNRVKIRLFIEVLKYHIFDLKSLKNDRF